MVLARGPSTGIDYRDRLVVGRLYLYNTKVILSTKNTLVQEIDAWAAALGRTKKGFEKNVKK